jgi:transglutaminase-like putative cysteine protease
MLKLRNATTLILIILMASNSPLAQATKSQRYVFRSTYVFENLGEKPFTLRDEDLAIVIFPDDEWQKVTLRNLSHDVVREYTDEDGNDLALPDIPAVLLGGTTITFSIEYDITSSSKDKPSIKLSEAEGLSEIPSQLVEEYCVQSESFYWNDEIEELAQELTSDETTALGMLTNLIDWMLDSMTYCNFEVPNYPNETLEIGKGDCDDQGILLSSMLRSLGIPAFLQVGVVFGDWLGSDSSSWDGHLLIHTEGMGWHAWTMAYIPPWGWIPVDLTYTSGQDSMDILDKAYEYDSFIVRALNVSEQAYIGDSQASRERYIESDVYVSVVEVTLDVEAVTDWMKIVYYLLGAAAVGAFALYFIMLGRKGN